MRHLFGSAVRFGVCVAAFWQNTQAGEAVGDRAPAAVLHQYSDQQLGDYMALAVRGQKSWGVTRQHVILIDTSASQTGRYRENGLRLVREVVSGLPADHQVHLLAADTKVVPLTPSLTRVDSAEVQQAFVSLDQRTPLGATDLSAALDAVLKSASGEGPVSVLYIGDGLSSAGLLQEKEVRTVLSGFSDGRIAFHAALLGPRLDTQLSGLLVNHTGGLQVNLNEDSHQSTSLMLSRGMQETPAIITELTLSPAAVSLTETRPIAIRSDRHSLIYARGTAVGPVSVSAVTAGGEKLSWNLAADSIVHGGAEICALFRLAEVSSGLNQSVVGLDGFETASRELDSTVDRTVQAATQLIQQGRVTDAAAVARRAVDLHGSDIRLTALMATIQENGESVELTPPVPAALAAATVSDEPATQDENEGLNSLPSGDDPLRDAESRIEITTQKISREVDEAIDNARRSSTTEPEYAEAVLKDILFTIRDSGEIHADVRAELERRVTSALESVSVAAEKNRLQLEQASQREATIESQHKLLTQATLDEERLQTLIEQVRGLLDRGRHGDTNSFEDAEQVARKALELAPGNGTATAALFSAVAHDHLSKIYTLRNLRSNRFLETLYQVELSHVPFPDEPPVLYPPADVWRALTLARKERYDSVDLRSEEAAETWLYRMLDEPIPQLDFQGEVSLKEVLDVLSDHYTNTYGNEGAGTASDFRMTIIPDTAELELDGVTSLEDVKVSNIIFSGIKLRNLMTLLFSQTKEPELTFMIRNEVMLITTVLASEKEENLTTRVYEVGDLVMPIVVPQGGGAGGGGGFGGGQGGIGGGGGGFGGGQGGFGGGGGFGSLPAEFLTPVSSHEQPQGISNKPLQQLKKKPATKS